MCPAPGNYTFPVKTIEIGGDPVTPDCVAVDSIGVTIPVYRSPECQYTEECGHLAATCPNGPYQVHTDIDLDKHTVYSETTEGGKVLCWVKFTL